MTERDLSNLALWLASDARITDIALSLGVTTSHAELIRAEMFRLLEERVPNFRPSEVLQ